MRGPGGMDRSLWCSAATPGPSSVSVTSSSREQSARRPRGPDVCAAADPGEGEDPRWAPEGRRAPAGRRRMAGPVPREVQMCVSHVYIEPLFPLTSSVRSRSSLPSSQFRAALLSAPLSSEQSFSPLLSVQSRSSLPSSQFRAALLSPPLSSEQPFSPPLSVQSSSSLRSSQFRAAILLPEPLASGDEAPGGRGRGARRGRLRGRVCADRGR